VASGAGWSIEGWLAAFEQNVEAHVQGVLAACRAAAPDGDAACDELLRRHEAQPDPLLARVVASQNPTAPRGASPDELRRVLEAVATRAQAELHAFVATSPTAATLPVHGRIAARLASMALHESNRHREALASARSGLPAAPAVSVGGIFANAARTAPETPWAQSYQQGAAANTLTCAHCGGAQERPLDFACRYCRKPMGGPAPG
jgi:hypothetical protein